MTIVCIVMIHDDIGLLGSYNNTASNNDDN
jgi:hypothetical protein